MCQSPIWIRNRAYSSRTIGLTDRKVLLMNRPWDYFTQRLMVPCGRCEECLRQQRNDWYVRLERETKYHKSLHHNSVFVTITIAPEYYDRALMDPSSFIRLWFERIRRRFGSSIKHAVFQEFGIHPEQGNAPRLHFHGVLWDVSYSYNAIREAVKDLGFVWISSISDKRLRYVVKYVGKSVYMDERSAVFARSLPITVGKLKTNLYDFLQNSRYHRKFISPGVGDYLGDFKAPGVTSGLWSYTDYKTGVVYRYRIPRYYDKYLSQDALLFRKISTAWTYANAFGSSLALGFLREVAERVLRPSDFSCVVKGGFSRLVKLREFLSKVKDRQRFISVTSDVIDFWIDCFGVNSSNPFFNKIVYG